MSVYHSIISPTAFSSMHPAFSHESKKNKIKRFLYMVKTQRLMINTPIVTVTNLALDAPRNAYHYQLLL